MVGVRVSRLGDNGKITRSRILAGYRKAVRIPEMRIGCAQLTGLFVHQLGESFHASGRVTRQTTGDVIRALDQEGAEQIDPLIGLARLDVQLDRFRQSIDAARP